MATKKEKLTALGGAIGCTELAPEYIQPEATSPPETALTIMPPPAALAVVRPPKQVLEEAREAATALVEVIKAKKNPFMVRGEVYLQFEDWQTVAKFYGATVKVAETKYLEYGEVAGFEAKAVVLNSNGMEISGAEAMCLNDEPNWKKKPLFQLKSMAQTRASAKALRNVFAWVVVLAGYKPTPAEEMDGVKPRSDAPPVELEHVEGIVERPTMSGGSLWFQMGPHIYTIPPMRGGEMKTLLEQAEKAFVELKVAPLSKTAGGKEYRIVKEIVKFEPDVPF